MTLKTLKISQGHQYLIMPVHVFTGSDVITGSNRIGPEIGYLAHF